MNQNRQQPEEEMNISEEELAALDRELAQMAQETPEMPDDFHARWTQKVREEAGQTKQKTRTETRRQWRYVLSAAAVFVFLIGGTLLTRHHGTTDLRTTANKTEVTEALQGPIATGVLEVNAGAVGEEPVDALYATNFAEPGSMMGTVEDAAAANESEAAAGDVGAAPATEGERRESKAAAVPNTMTEADSMTDDAEAAFEAEETVPETEEAAQEPAEPTAAPTPEAAAEAEEGEPDSFGAFLKDFGHFSLIALPILAALFAAVFLLRRVAQKKQ